MSGLVRGSLEEALSAALLNRALPADPGVVDELVGAVTDWADSMAGDSEGVRLAWALPRGPAARAETYGPWWSGKTLEALATMLRRRW